jgi:preprotein translocase subunit YajC
MCIGLIGVALVAAPAWAADNKPAAGIQQQWQEVHGSVVSVQGSTLTFKADDGRTLTVDMSKVNPAIQKALTPNEKATIVGFAGSQPNQFTAQFIQQDSSDPSRGGRIVGQTPAGTDESWQRIHGTINSVSGNTLSLKTDDGQTITVDLAQVDAGIRNSLKQGEGVTVIGFYRVDDKKNVDKKQVEARFVQKDSSAAAPAASPRTAK